MQAGVGLLILDVMTNIDHCLGYHHNYSIFYQLPNSNLFTHRILFSREKPPVKSPAPGSIFPSYIFRSILLFAFFIYLCLLFSDLYYQKPKNTSLNLFAFILFAPNNLSLYQSFTREGLTTPILRRVASICSLCVGTIYIVLLGYPTVR